MNKVEVEAPHKPPPEIGKFYWFRGDLVLCHSGGFGLYSGERVLVRLSDGDWNLYRDHMGPLVEVSEDTVITITVGE